MDKKIFIGWLVLLVWSFVLIMIGISSAKMFIYSDTKSVNVRQLDDWEITKQSEPNENGMYSVKYVTKVPLIHNGSETIMFYTYHSNVTAYVEGRRIYSMFVNQEEDKPSVVLGDVWNQFMIMKEHEGKFLEIVVETPYSSYLDYIPEFMLGNELDIVLAEMKSSLFSIFLSVGILISGVYLALYAAAISKNGGSNFSMFYLGIFAMLIAIWFLVNIPIIHFIIAHGIILTYISYLLLAAIAVPFILFEKQIMHKKFRIPLNCVCILIMAVQLACVLMQIFNIYNMKESLILVHIALGVFILIFVLTAAINIKITGVKNISRVNLVNIVCAVLAAAGVAIDMARYYSDPNGGKEYLFTKIALLIYILSLAYNTIKETEQIMEKAKEAERFEMLAYMDELTGVCNRTAYNKLVEETDIEKYSYTVFMFDLNNLKKCNDTLGHHYGDEYIRSSARFIKEAFQHLGTCYRIGGDEFCIIAQNAEESHIGNAYEKLNEKIQQYNKDHKILNINIACGHAKYEKDKDKNLEDTRERADKLMYENKIKMKQAAKEKEENKN